MRQKYCASQSLLKKMPRLYHTYKTLMAGNATSHIHPLRAQAGNFTFKLDPNIDTSLKVILIDNIYYINMKILNILKKALNEATCVNILLNFSFKKTNEFYIAQSNIIYFVLKIKLNISNVYCINKANKRYNNNISLSYFQLLIIKLVCYYSIFNPINYLY